MLCVLVIERALLEFFFPRQTFSYSYKAKSHVGWQVNTKKRQLCSSLSLEKNYITYYVYIERHEGGKKYNKYIFLSMIVDG
jgi:hypothetical protein